MTSAPDPLPVEFVEAFDRVSARLGPLGRRVMFYSTIGSTNDVAAELAAQGVAEGLVVLADAQTAGRGRRGRTWFSPPGSGLYASVVLTPARASSPARATGLLTLTAGVALAEGIAIATGLAPDIKWPNDLLVGGRKLAGILAEGVASSGETDQDAGVLSVVLGFGINISPSVYPPELRARATSLEAELGRQVDRALVCAESIASLARRYDDLVAGRFDAILDDWRRRATGLRGARVQWQDVGGIRHGITAGIDETGALLVQSDGAIQRLVAGEVLWD
jgi:BirA family biotin operon repressor/biotin-[acetyl-CoA-carboxylase] ligase